MSQALLCPACETPHGPAERFCPDCGLPLVLPPEERAPLTAAQERARKVRASYAEGPLVRIAAARNQPEAELLQGLLLEEGIPSMVRRSGGFDVPDFLAAGTRDVLVPQSGATSCAPRRRGRGCQATPRPARGCARWRRRSRCCSSPSWRRA